MFRKSIAIAKQEAAQIFKTTKGKLVLGLFWVWAVVPGLYQALSLVEMNDLQRRDHVMAIITAYDVDVATHLLLCPLGLMLAAISSFQLAPFATLALSSLRAGSPNRMHLEGETSTIGSGGDRALGEMLGAWGAFCAALLAVFLPIAVAEVVADQYAPLLTLKWAFELYLGNCVVAAAYLALWRPLKTYFLTRRAALIANASVALVLLIARPFIRLKAPTLAQLLPGSLDRLLLSGAPNLVARALLITAGWLVMALAVSAFIRRSRLRTSRVLPVATESEGSQAPQRS